MKKSLIVTALSMAACLAAGSFSVQAEETVTVNGTYSLYVEGDDWGCGTNKVYLSLDQKLDSVKAEDFAVSETKTVTDWADPALAEVTQSFDRAVTAAYFADEDGNPVSDPTDLVVLELYISPSDGSPVNYSGVNGYNYWTSPYYLTITASDLTVGGKAASLVIPEEYTGMVTEFDTVAVDTFTASDGMVYPYAHYEPEGGSDAIVVWLHGGGEGGSWIYGEATDPRIILLANEAGNLFQDDFQNAVGGANILIPQSESYWMDVEGRTDSSLWSANDGTSCYTASLKELIDAYKEQTGASKVVLTGCSNGGFMSILMAKTYPDAFTAIVPICPPFHAADITDEEVEAIKDLPMYVIYSQNDDTVIPEEYEIPLLEKFNAAGASHIFLFTPENIPDTTGRFTDAEGNAYQYAGHWSWIYFFNNEAKDNETGLTAWDFIAENIK